MTTESAPKSSTVKHILIGRPSTTTTTTEEPEEEEVKIAAILNSFDEVLIIFVLKISGGRVRRRNN